MATPKGMKWIDLTYLTNRIDYEQDDRVIQAEASMTVLVEESAADCLLYGGSLADIKMAYVVAIARNREYLCRGRYVEDSLTVRLAEGDEDR